MTTDTLHVQDIPLISVALCVHDGARFLHEQLDSVLAQRDVAIEVVALDDVSHDASPALLHEYAVRDPRVRCFRNDTNLGPSRSFERAMSLTRGAFIAPCDQDDVWEPDKLAKLLAAIDSVDLAYCDSAYIDESGVPTGTKVSDDIEMLSGHEPLTFLFANSVSGHAALLRRELFEAARPFPAEAFHDWWLALCAAATGGIVYVPEPLVRFRRHAETVSTLGRDRKGRRPPTRNRAWLAQRRAIMVAHAGSTLRGHTETKAFLQALDAARDTDRSGLLLRELWHLRHVLPGRRNSPRNVLRWWLRFGRKLRCAGKEPNEPASPFRP